MADEQKAKSRLEITHVLFVDVVGYSKLLINERQALQKVDVLKEAREV